MAEMVGSAVVQEVVSGAFSYMRNSHEEMAGQSHLMERLKMAHFNIMFALERTKGMPVIDVSLLQIRMMLKHASEESRDLLNKQHTLRINLEKESAEEQGVTLSTSLSNRIMHAVKPFLGTEKGSISGSSVRRFEWFAQKAGEFVRDVQSGFSLALYRFSCPIITQLLEGKCLKYEMVSGSQPCTLKIWPFYLEDYGVMGNLIFEFKDLETPMKCFSLHLMLRLSASTNIVGISTKCLQSLQPPFKPMADVASGELAQISTQISVYRPGQVHQECALTLMKDILIFCRQEPLCCIDDGFQPSAKKILSSELTEKFPKQVYYLRFECFISAAEYNLKAWPILELSVLFRPHALTKIQDEKVGTYIWTSPGEFCRASFFWASFFLDLSEMAKCVLAQAVECFMLEPERTEYWITWRSRHGLASFTVSKPATEMGCAPKIGDGPKTRRASKRKRVKVQTSD